jgi:hypothetical protein
LAAFLYIESHRFLGLTHQGTIIDLVRKCRVFLWLLYNPFLKLSRLELLPDALKGYELEVSLNATQSEIIKYPSWNLAPVTFLPVNG